ncbi:MAG TPA: hypothetical protein VF681_07845 [Abditibacteriaceae bacterium]
MMKSFSPVRSPKPHRAVSSRRAFGSRRRGQALLMAVLLMVFAAVLGATFVTVVSLNLSQTQRTVSRGEAVTAAQAGLKFANDQITFASVEGEAWRPEKMAPPPDSTDPSYNEYYTPFEQAQGWARSVPKASTGDTIPTDNSYGVSTVAGDWNNNAVFEADADDWAKLAYYKAKGSRVFVKFPDPRGRAVPGPFSLMEVSVDSDPSSDKRGMLRITVIGRGEDNDAAFSRLTAYKPTSSNGGPLSYARFDANFDAATNKPLEGLLQAAVTAPTAPISPNPPTPVVINLGKPLNVEPGRTLMIGEGTTTGYGVVQSVSGATVTLRSLVPAGVVFPAQSPVRAASVLMQNLDDENFDSDGDGAKGNANTWERTATTLLRPFFDASWTRGYRFNGGLVAQEKTTLGLKTEAVEAKSTVLQVAGPVNDSGTTVVNDAATNSNTTLAASPLVYSKTNVGSPQVVPMAPPTRQSFERYRLATRDDSSAGSPYGYGPGVYIDNRDDVEKIASSTGFVALKNFEVQRLWQRKPFGGNALFYPAATNTAPHNFPKPTGSLEERGIRGWVNPWQFLPRGALIELKGDEIVITRDDRSERAGRTVDTAKAWKNPDGSLLEAATQPGRNTFRMRYVVSGADAGKRFFGAPDADVQVGNAVAFQGVIFTEGNARVRGYLNRAVTIVSMNNIYVEGNVGTSGQRVALVAKNNVTLNPTQFVSRVAGVQDVDVALTTSGTVNSQTQITVPANSIIPDGTSGQRVRIGNEAAWQTVKSATGGVLVLYGAGTKATSTVDVSTNDIPLTNAGTSSISFAANYSAYFRVGDLVRFATTNDPYTITSITSGTQFTATLDRPLVGVPTSVQHVTDPIFTRGDNLLYPITPATPVANGHTPEWFYRVQSANYRNADHFIRDVHFDGATLPATDRVTLGLQHSGDRVNAVNVKPLAVPATPTDEIPTTPSLLIRNDANTNSLIDANEKYFTLASSPAADGGKWDFSVDLLAFATPNTDAGNDLNDFSVPTRWTKGTDVRWRTTVDPALAPYAGNDAANPSYMVAARRLARLSRTNIATGTVALPPAGVDVPLTTSLGIFWNATTTDGLPDVLVGSALSDTATTRRDAIENIATVDESFYWQGTDPSAANQKQAMLKWMGFGTLTPQTQNNLVFRGDNAGALPSYRLGMTRLERAVNGVAWQAGDFAVDNAATPNLEDPQQAMPITVRATIYAGEGSWFVIPQPLGTNFDVDNNNVLSDAEKATASRYRRANYAIRVIGNITQNFTPTAIEDYDTTPVADPDGRFGGAMSQWIDSSAYPQTVQANGVALRGSTWSTISYQADPLPTNSGLALPVSPDLLYVG